MKKHLNLTVIALTLLTAGAAMAGGLSREEVVAELVRARNAGELLANSYENPEAARRTEAVAPSTISRAAVLAELKRARAAGELDRPDADYGLPLVVTTQASTKTRAEVKAELAAARASGELELINGNSSDYAHLRIQAKPAAQSELLAGQPKRDH